MDYKIDKHKKRNTHKYKKDELDLALAFSKEAHKEFKDFVKGIILFGSAARKLTRQESKKSEGDIDVLILVDDISIEISKELIETYKIISQKIVAKISPRIHVTTLKLSTFWNYIRIGDPVGINILRDGVAIIDTGFFDPLQALLYKGSIKPSYESIWTYFNRAPEALNGSRARLLEGTIDLYWAVIDAAQATLMKIGSLPPSPEHVADMLEEKLVKPGLCTQRYADIMRDMYNLQKEITHRKKGDISGAEYDKWYAKAKDFVDKMRRIINHLAE